MCVREKCSTDAGSNERASVTLVMVAGLCIFGLLLLAVGRLAGAASDQSRARTAADAAALAGAAEGCGEAAQLASANGATLTQCQVEGDDVQVAVQVRQSSATARARKELPTTSEAVTSEPSPTGLP